LAHRPNLWQTYAAAKNEIWQASKPVAHLKTQFASQAAAIDAAVARTGRKSEKLAYLPMVGRKSFWTVLLDPVTAEVLGFMPLDSF
jgi:ABC-type transporter Mla subunit MlaD